jgi:hypothetical protein
MMIVPTVVSHLPFALVDLAAAFSASVHLFMSQTRNVRNREQEDDISMKCIYLCIVAPHIITVLYLELVSEPTSH